MRRLVWIALAAALAVVLSACTVSGGVPIEDDVDAEVTARIGTGGGLSAQDPVATSIRLLPGEDRLFRVNLPSSQEPGLYVYLDRALDLYLYSGSGSLHATSSSSAYFGSRFEGFDVRAAPSGLAPQIAVAETCPGSCIIARYPGSGGVYVRVANPTSSTVSVTLWAVLRSFADSNEASFGESDPAPIAANDAESGAIETLGDVDYFYAADDGTVTFDYAAGAVTGLDLVAEIVSFDTGTTRIMQPGESRSVRFSDEIRVRARNARAAASANSRYFLSLQPY